MGPKIALAPSLLLLAGLLAGLGYQTLAHGLQTELLALLVLSAPLLLAPLLARAARAAEVPRTSAILAIASVAAIRVDTVQDWGFACSAIALLWWVRASERRECEGGELPDHPGEIPPGPSRWLAQGILIAGICVSAYSQSSSNLTLLVYLLCGAALLEALLNGSPLRQVVLGLTLLALGLLSLWTARVASAQLCLLFLAVGLRPYQGQKPGGAFDSLLTQVTWCLIPLIGLPSTQYYRTDAPPVPAMNGGLKEKLHYYAAHKAEVDLVWIGDSRTAYGVDPFFLDPHLGLRSLNLSLWMNWIPTQYAFSKDLLEQLAPGTTVVWLIGHQNFAPFTGPISEQYPIPLEEVPLYLSLGFSWSSLRPNLVTHSQLGTPTFAARTFAARLRSRFEGLQATRVWFAPHEDTPETGDPYAEECHSLLAELERDPKNLPGRIRSTAGRSTSLDIPRARGGYHRHEVDHAFFRAKQEELRERLRGHLLEPYPPEVDRGRWGLYLRILDNFKAHGVDLIVCEIEEAPYSYPPGEREQMRRFMREIVAPEARARGFPYVVPDYDQLRDEHYFDYNHLNRRGVERFSPLLVEAIRPALKAK